jgi:hypothetical protein
MTENAGVPEAEFKTARFDWMGLYELCALYQVGYKGLDVEFRWRTFSLQRVGVRSPYVVLQAMTDAYHCSSLRTVEPYSRLTL